MAPKYLQNTGGLFPDPLSRHEENLDNSDYCPSCDDLYAFEDLCEVCGFCYECCDGDCSDEADEDEDDDAAAEFMEEEEDEERP